MDKALSSLLYSNTEHGLTRCILKIVIYFIDPE